MRDVAAPLLRRDWACPSCPYTLTNYRGDVHTPHHECPNVRGLMVPLVPAGARGEHRVIEREDYVGDDDVRLDGAGRPTMAVELVRDDGTDRTVYAPCARARVQ